jgi:hypothetical protein
MHLRGRKAWTWSRALALLPLLLLVASLPAQVLLRCRFDGRLRTACCCPDQKDAEGPATPAVSGRSCCQREASRDGAPTVAVGRAASAPEAAAPALVPLLSVDVAAPGRPSAQIPRSRPPPAGPPLTLLKHSFLI